MSRQDDPASVTLLAWRAAWVGLIVVFSLTVVLALLIAYRGEETQAALTPDRFDERWQIRSGTVEAERLALHPSAQAISVALRPIAVANGRFTAQTHATFDQPTGAAGLIVQADDADHFVAFIISADGYFRLSDYRNGVWIDRVAWRTWPHIRRDGSPNTLRATCRADACTFFVNDEWTWQAESIPATLKVGVVAAGLDASSGGEVMFEQFALQSL
jgi:hypothetical protein